MNIESQPVRYTGTQVANTDYHDGQLRPAIGVHSYQVLRANRSASGVGRGLRLDLQPRPDARLLERPVLPGIPEQPVRRARPARPDAADHLDGWHALGQTGGRLPVLQGAGRRLPGRPTILCRRAAKP